jgi:peptidyl-prolyl cis-trans isomerase C
MLIGQIALTAATLGLWANHLAAQAPAADKVAARVNGEDIPLAELQAVLDTRPSPVPVSKELQREMRKAAIEMLVDDLLMRQFLRRAVAPVDPMALQKEYDKLHEALKKQKKTMEQFLQEGKMTADMLRADIVARLQWKAYLEKSYAEAEMKSYYEANKVFFDNVLVRASHILVKVSANANAEDRQRARAKLDIIRQEILAGKITFEDAARKYSDCPSKDKGGDIGQFPYKLVVFESLARAAFAVKKGELTDIVSTENGLHLVKVTDRTAGEPSRFEDSRDAVREVMAQESDLYQRILDEQKTTAKIEEFVQ